MRHALALLALLTTSLSPAAALHCEVLSGPSHAQAHGAVASPASGEHDHAAHQAHPHDGAGDPATHADCRLVMVCGASMMVGPGTTLASVVLAVAERQRPASRTAPLTDTPASDPPPPRAA